MAIKALIIDDEPLARKMIAEYLAGYSDIELVGMSENGRTAVADIEAFRPDLIFLDIQMPGLDGFEVLEQIDHTPFIIFSTADDSSAIQAFETGAVDYLLKPYDKERFDKALSRALERLEKKESTVQDVAALLQAIKSSDSLAGKLLVRVGERIMPVQMDDILWIEAAGDYAKIHTDATSYLCSQGIGALEKRLDTARFARVHRSSIIAVSAIQHIRSDKEGGYKATLVNGQEVKISRTFAPQIRRLIV